MSESPLNAYESTPVDYLTRISRLFGEYKKRAFIFTELKPGESLLDAGCGAGDDLLAVATSFPNAGALYGIDLDDSTLQTARERAAAAGVQIDFQVGDLASMPYADDAMDVVRSDRVFQHLERPAAVLKEMIRVTKPGGRVIGIDVDWGSLIIDHPQVELTEKICDFARDHHINGRSGRQLRRLFLEHGLKEVQGYADAVCVPDWQIAGYIWGLQALIERFAASGGCSREEAGVWWRLAEEAAEADRFCASMTGFAMRGTVG